MKKILFVIRSLEFGGAEKSLVNLLHELPPEEYEIHLLLFKKKGGFLTQLPENVQLLESPKALKGLFAPLKKSGKYGMTKLLGTACSKLGGKTRKERMAFRWKHFYKKVIPVLPGSYDVAVAYVGTEVLYYVADRVQARKKYVWIHNDYRAAAYSKKDDTPYFEKIDGIVSVSEDCVRVLQEEFPQYRDKIYLTQNITSSAAVRRMAEEYIPAEYKDTCNILSVGRLSRQKGFDMAIQAAALLKKQGVKFCWYVIGEGDQKENLTQMLKTCDVADCFFLLGTRSNPYPYMKHCTFLAQTSRFEGKSVVLDEAKILAVPILATAYPTVADEIHDGAEGLVTAMTAEGIAQGIMNMTPQLCKKFQTYLNSREYGNQAEVIKYRKLLDA